MYLPIQYALYWPERRPGPAAKFDWTQSQQFEFHPPDLDRFDALRLGFEVARIGGTGGAVLNARQRSGRRRLPRRRTRLPPDRPPVPSSCWNTTTYEASPLAGADSSGSTRWARGEVARWISTGSPTRSARIRTVGRGLASATRCASHIPQLALRSSSSFFA